MKLCQVVSTLSLMFLSISTAYAGRLSPPVGPVAPTMKSLDQIEPRRCINDLPGSAGAVHVITETGVYFLADRVVVPNGKVAIEIDAPAASRVTLHLGGFDITGEPGALGGIVCSLQPLGGDILIHGDGSVIEAVDGDGISFPAALASASISDLTVRSCGGSGIKVLNTASVSSQGVLVSDCDGDGVHLENGHLATLDVSVTQCGGDGVEVVSFVEFQTAKEQLKGGPRHRVANCGGYGLVTTNCCFLTISSLDVTQCSSGGTFHTMSGNGDVFSMFNSRVTQCGGDGIQIVGADSVELRSVSVSDCTGDGIDLADDSDGKLDCDFTDISAQRSAGHGMRLVFSEPVRFRAGVGHSSFSQNGISGLHASFAPGGGALGGGEFRVTDSTFSDNALDGMTLDRDGSASLEVVMEDAAFSRNGGSGLKSYFETGDIPTQEQFHSLDRCTAHNNGETGFHVQDSSVLMTGPCSASNNVGDGAFVERTTTPGHKYIDTLTLRSTNNGQYGLHVWRGASVTVTRCDLSGNGFISPAGGDGLHVLDAEQVSITDTQCVSNLACGINVGINEQIPDTRLHVSRCSASQNGASGLLVSGLSSVQVTDTQCRSNASDGISLGDVQDESVLDRVTCSSNGASGVFTQTLSGLPCGRTVVRQCSTDNNFLDGVSLACSSGGEIRQCVSTNNGGLGFGVFATGHVVVQNTCGSNGLGAISAIVPGNSVGPMIDELDITSNCNAHANYLR